MRPFAAFVARSIFVLLAGTSALAATLLPTGSSVPGEVIIKMRSGISVPQLKNIQDIADADQSRPIASTSDGTIWKVHSRSRSAEALVDALDRDANIEYVEPNYIVHLEATPNDPQYWSLWGLKNTGQVVGSAGIAGSDIRAESAWNITTGSASIVVGVVDSGIDYTHSDLAANVWSNPGGKGNANCAAGTHGFNALTDTCDPQDDYYHGTHVAGTIGAVGNNGIGVTGVNWTTSIMGLKFIDSNGNGTLAGAIEAIDFAVQAKIDGVNVRVLSNSWGGFPFSKALLDEINKANANDILFVASAGNNSSSNDSFGHYPSSYAAPNVIAVAALDNRDNLAYFSNYGLRTVHLGAPGVSVLSTTPGNNYQYLSGTSMAAPHVAGVAALVLAHSPSFTTAQVRSAILDNTDPINSMIGKSVTGGRLNAARALGLPADPGFRISVSPASRTVVQGDSTTYTITVNPIGGFAGSVDLSISGLPSGFTAAFNPTQTSTTSTLTVTTPSSAWTYYDTPFTITGTSGALVSAVAASIYVTSPPVQSPCPSFSPFSAYYSGNQNFAGAAGDFDRDGYPDLAGVDSAQNRVTVVFGVTRSPSAVSYSVGTTPLAIATGDFNRDGRPDLVTANAGSNNVSFLLGSTNSSFQSATNYAAAGSPFSVAVGDFNGDGKSDLAVANNGTANVSILLGLGNGTFQPAVNYSTGSGPFWVIVADFDGDGHQDLAVPNFNAANVTILAGNGDGTFGSAVSYATGNGPSGVAAADLNHDGKLDLAVSNYGGDDVAVLLGNGDRTFQAAVHYAAGQGPYFVAIADVNGDGIPDLATANSGSRTASIFLGTGSGMFLAAVQHPTDNEPSQLVFADFNRDGRMDFVAPGQGAVAYNYLIVRLNIGTCTANCGTLAPPADSVAGTTPDAVATGDFDRDGDLDLAVANKSSNDVSILPGNGTASLTAGATTATGTSPDAILAADFDADGMLDLAVANRGSNDVSILRGNGNGTFQTAVSYSAGSGPRGIATGDFNRDGKIDLAVANDGSGNVSILLGNGNATFQTAVPYTAGSHPAAIATGDFDRDGKIDLVVANSGSDNVSIFTGNGDGTFQAAVSINTGTAPGAVVVADLNRDAYDDLAVANSGSNNVSILFGKDVGFQSAVSYAAGNSPAAVVARDFNLDGVPDLAVANNGSDNVSILSGVGAGTFNPAINAGTGDAPAGLLAGDFNRDGKPDLVSANSGDSTVSVLLDTCPIPDLTITKTHSGTFAQGNTGRTYTITVTNSGSLPTNGSVTVADTIPSGLIQTAIGGTGWTCILSTTTCTRNDALAAGSSYPVITLTVNVAGSAAASVTNNVTVSGGGELNTVNSSASDVTTITPVTDLAMSSTHIGSFTQGDTGRTYRLLASNIGGVATAGAATVTDSLPAGLTATAISGAGWSCTLATLTCTRSDVLAAYTSYAPIILIVSVASNAPSSVANTATVSGGADTNAGNNTAVDQTTIWSTQTCGTFGTPTFYGTSSGATNLAVADFNADGKNDIAVASYNGVSIFLGNGDGTMGSENFYTVSNGTSAIAAGDLNHDGNLDLALGSYYSFGVTVLLGTGDGTFQPAIFFPSPYSINSLVLDDFDRDGNLDVAIGTSNTPGVAVLLGSGNGALRSAVTYQVNSTHAIGSADFNGDGNPDLVASYYGSGGAILIGNGDGTFQSPAAYSGGYGAALAIADLNRDGKLDLALAGSYVGDSAIVLGNGNGTFQSPLTMATPYGASSVKADDINGDGNIDLAFVTSYYGYVATMRGNGDGTFQSADVTSVSSSATNLAISDFNGDGKADIAATAYYSGKVAILMSACPDLTITKSHYGNAIGGQTNFIYTLRVSNSGGSSHGKITVTDNLPAGLTATNIYGYGWTCTLETLTCTRSDSLSAGPNYYYDISVFVTVLSSAPASVTNVATISGGGDSNSANNSASDPTTILPSPDLAIAMSHTPGVWAQGDTGRTYTITVSNVGNAATSGTVSVTDTPPYYGMSITGMTGAGWSCVLSQATCTRSDSLSAGSSYPPITVTVNVGYNGFPANNGAGVSSNNSDGSYFNNFVNDFTAILATPVGIEARAVSVNEIRVTWSWIAYATGFQVYRSSNGSPYTLVAEVPAGASQGFQLQDGIVAKNTAYVYKVRAVNGATVTPFSNPELATTIMFTDDPIGSNVPIKAAHITELRAAINAVRATAGLPPATFAETVTAGVRIKANHQMELRNLLDEARIVLGLPVVGYITDPQLTPGVTIIKGANVRDLRLGVN